MQKDDEKGIKETFGEAQSTRPDGYLPITFHTPPILKARIRQLAKERGVTMSAIISRTLEDALLPEDERPFPSFHRDW